MIAPDHNTKKKGTRSHIKTADNSFVFSLLVYNQSKMESRYKL